MSRLAPFALILAAACADDLAGVEVADPSAGARAGDRWYHLSVDDRDCATCGGFFVSVANRSQTACLDGTALDACHVDALDLTPLALDDESRARFDLALSEGRLLVRARMVRDPAATVDGVLLDVASAREGLSGADPVGEVVQINQTGRLCGPLPCEDLTEWTLNMPRVRWIADLDFSPSALTDEEIRVAWSATTEAAGLMVAGDRYRIDDGTGLVLAGRTVTEAWIPLAP